MNKYITFAVISAVIMSISFAWKNFIENKCLEYKKNNKKKNITCFLIIDGLTSLKLGAFRTGEEIHMNLTCHK